MANGIKIKKCGIKFDPPSLLINYEKEDGKLRLRTMPLRNFTKTTSVPQAADELLSNSGHIQILKKITRSQLERLITIISDKLKGMSLEASLARNDEMEQIDPTEDLNKVDEEALRRKKSLMENTFEKHQTKPGDEDYVYDKEVEFGEAVETCEWDSDESDPDF